MSQITQNENLADTVQVGDQIQVMRLADNAYRHGIVTARMPCGRHTIYYVDHGIFEDIMLNDEEWAFKGTPSEHLTDSQFFPSSQAPEEAQRPQVNLNIAQETEHNGEDGAESGEELMINRRLRIPRGRSKKSVSEIAIPLRRSFRLLTKREVELVSSEVPTDDVEYNTRRRKSRRLSFKNANDKMKSIIQEQTEVSPSDTPNEDNETDVPPLPASNERLNHDPFRVENSEDSSGSAAAPVVVPPSHKNICKKENASKEPRTSRYGATDLPPDDGSRIVVDVPIPRRSNRVPHPSPPQEESPLSHSTPHTQVQPVNGLRSTSITKNNSDDQKSESENRATSTRLSKEIVHNGPSESYQMPLLCPPSKNQSDEGPRTAPESVFSVVLKTTSGSGTLGSQSLARTIKPGCLQADDGTNVGSLDENRNQNTHTVKDEFTKKAVEGIEANGKDEEDVRRAIQEPLIINEGKEHDPNESDSAAPIACNTAIAHYDTKKDSDCQREAGSISPQASLIPAQVALHGVHRNEASAVPPLSPLNRTDHGLNVESKLLAAIACMEKKATEIDTDLKRQLEQFDRQRNDIQSLQGKVQDMQKKIAKLPTSSGVKSLLEAQNLEAKNKLEESMGSIVAELRNEVSNIISAAMRDSIRAIAEEVRRANANIIKEAVS